MKALVTGATGLIGRHLVRRLDAPHVLVRKPADALRSLGGVAAFAWRSEDAVSPDALRGVDVVFHLAGEPVAAGRMTDARKRAIRDSRVVGTRRIVESIRDASERPRVLVCASALGIFGSRGDELLTEESAAGSDFLAKICVDWEKEAREAEALGVRVISLRTGLALARDGGALAAMRPAFRFGVGGPLGSGKQWAPWIHLDDVVGLALHAAEHAQVTGPMNVCSPNPVRNEDFARALGHAVHRPAFLRTPELALRLAVGELSDVLLASTRAVPAKALATGYAFRFTSLDDALRDLESPANESTGGTIAPASQS
jgi:uncharacterized protein (TIGR01777 family)